MSNDIPAPDAALATGAEPASTSATLLQAEIAITRERLASDVDALADRLSPESLKRQLAASVEKRLVGAAWAVRRNPVPLVVLLGVGVALAVWRVRSSRT